jgi:hypothetical protein
LAIIAVTMSSCADNCCTLLTAKICESDMPAGYDSWDEYADYLDSIGYNCN